MRTLAQLPLRNSAVEAVGLALICQLLIAVLRKRDPTRNVTIEMPGSLLLVGHKNFLATALSCLLENAWKFTSKKPEAWIKIGVQPGKAVGERVLVVADNGMGFDRLHSSADFPGNGLGLAIIKRVALIHGGTVGARVFSWRKDFWEAAWGRLLWQATVACKFRVSSRVLPIKAVGCVSSQAAFIFHSRYI